MKDHNCLSTLREKLTDYEIECEDGVQVVEKGKNLDMTYWFGFSTRKKSSKRRVAGPPLVFSFCPFCGVRLIDKKGKIK